MASVPPTGIAARVLPGSKSVSLDYVPSGAGAVPAPLGKFCNCKVSRSFSKLQVQLAAGPEDCPSCPLSIRDKTLEYWDFSATLFIYDRASASVVLFTKSTAILLF